MQELLEGKIVRSFVSDGNVYRLGIGFYWTTARRDAYAGWISDSDGE